MGALGWSPAAFADATWRDLDDAWRGYRKANGIMAPEKMTRDELDNLKAKYPDGRQT